MSDKKASVLMGYSVKDEKMHTFSSPMFMAGVAELVRSLIMLAKKQPDNLMVQFPADYSIWAVCEWDGMTGRMDVLFDKEHVLNMVDIVGQKQEVKNG